ncbi:hypothetical protein Taro_040916 [Colocasia esculenta]|uniref:Uncharacterized protein n=1 Tax=Colocasia esculenta TaxID=4460 RepID=A0A843WUC6_COLES|nr:hypothetical protein [Colocasia esculenta]
MAARPGQPPSMETFDAYFRRADLDMDGRVTGAEAVAFFQGSNLPKQVLAQIWMYSDSKKTGFLGRQEFYNALRLVTVAQSGQNLTPEIVKAALEGPAASKIPPPQISSVAVPPTSGNQMTMQRPTLNSTIAPSHQIGSITPTSSQNFGYRGPQALPNLNMSQQAFLSADGQYLKPNQAASVIPPRPLVGQGFLGGGMAAGAHLPNSNVLNISTDWPTGRMAGASVGGASQVPRSMAPAAGQERLGLAQSGLMTSLTPRAETPSVPPKPMDPLSSLQPSANDSKALVVSGNGFPTSSVFGDDVFTAMPPPRQDAFASINVPSSSTVVSMTSGLQTSVRQNQNAPSQSSSTMPYGSGQVQQSQSMVKQSPHEMVQSALSSTPSVPSVGTSVPGSSPSERAWPKFSQKDIQKYTRVFAEVDTDKDGKITGEEARQLFMSWKLPREILKQVWDLSDQDNDSMLSHREFVVALYLMERYREGYPLPSVLPNSVKYDETLLQATTQPSSFYSNPAWQPRPVYPQHGMSRLRPAIPVAGLNPQAQVKVPQQVDSSMQLVQQKLSGSAAENLSKEEHNGVNSEVQESTDSGKKGQELEKQIMDSKEKIEFYRTKMQDLVLYKTRCDNRLNEITEKASADKREVESLAKKYEEKYKQVAELASKLTIEEATFRDIQERKLELHNAIVKMDQGGSADGLLQVRADRIQSDLEELVKALNERCKKHDLHVKSTGVVELPFGWEPGIHEGAVDWDEEWDKFEDEGFAISKDLSVSQVSSSVNVDKKFEVPLDIRDHMVDSQPIYSHSEDGSMGSPPTSPRRSSLESQSQDFHSAKVGVHDDSPRLKADQSNHARAESTSSGGKFIDETSWGAAFDTNNDADSVWDFNSKEFDHDVDKQNSFFGSGDLGLDPIRTASPSATSVFGMKERSTFFADSVPGTPQFNSNSSPRFSEGPEERSFDSFGRFDSFSMHDSGFFSQRENLARFDSIRSTSDQSQRYAFDDTDPFGSTGPFKTSEGQTARKGSDNWSSF